MSEIPRFIVSIDGEPHAWIEGDGFDAFREACRYASQYDVESNGEVRIEPPAHISQRRLMKWVTKLAAEEMQASRRERLV